MIFVDMDGTLAKFYYHKKCLEKMYEREYFLRLKPYKIVDYIRKLVRKGKQEIYILSACINSPYCKEEKWLWVQEFLPEIDDDHIILCNTGENKAKIAARYRTGNENMILLDDYSENLYNWEMQGRGWYAVKFLNGINNKSEKEYRYKVRTAGQLNKVLSEIEDKDERPLTWCDNCGKMIWSEYKFVDGLGGKYCCDECKVQGQREKRGRD